MKFSFIIITALLLSPNSFSQLIPINDNAVKKYSFVNTVFNRIINSNRLDSFYQKLYDLKKTSSGVVTVVHIGDSHIQADLLTGLVRNNMQAFFGNAGRGLVFPYQLAQSNAPPDVISSSNTSWQFNRIAHPEIPTIPGISGYCIKTNQPGAAITLSLKANGNAQQGFNRLKLFVDSNASNSWILQANNNTPFVLKHEPNDTIGFFNVSFEKSAVSLSLSSLPSENTKEFYGVSLENLNAGVLYHTIGVNGARYDQYNQASLFWKQLPALHADLFIVSLGTNEAQRTTFDNDSFQQEITLFLQRLKQASPKAAILLTTAADSYYKRRQLNTVLRSINLSLYNYCTQNDIALWDLYRVTNGYGSAHSWSKQGLMNNDRIHFTADGYRLQGNLLFHALAKGYNNYVNSY